jgi:hypothetical protein
MRSLREVSTRNLPGGKGRTARKSDYLIAICDPVFWEIWEPRRLTNRWASAACDNFTFFFFNFLVVPSNLERGIVCSDLHLRVPLNEISNDRFFSVIAHVIFIN